MDYAVTDVIPKGAELIHGVVSGVITGNGQVLPSL
jgi:hypothetical protein